MYELLDHVADARFRATGPTLAATLGETVAAIAAICGTDPDAAAATTATTVEVTATDREGLVFDFLGELIYLQDATGVAVVEASEVTLTAPDERTSRSTDGDGHGTADADWRIRATVATVPITEPLFDLKSPTYDGLVVAERDGEWVIEATLDV